MYNAKGMTDLGIRSRIRNLLIAELKPVPSATENQCFYSQYFSLCPKHWIYVRLCPKRELACIQHISYFHQIKGMLQTCA